MPKRLVDLRDQAPLLDIVSYGRRAPGTRPISLFGRARPHRPHGRRRAGGHDQSIRRRRRAWALSPHISGTSTGKESWTSRLTKGIALVAKGSSVSCSRIGDWDSKSSRRIPPTRACPAESQRNSSTTSSSRCLLGTPPDKLLAAVRHFAQEKFALQHRYAMVLHTDHDHPHVHLVLKAVVRTAFGSTFARPRYGNGDAISLRHCACKVSPRMLRSGQCEERAERANPMDLSSHASR